MLISVRGNKKLWLLFFEKICQKNSWGSPLRTWKELYIKNQKIVKDYTVIIQDYIFSGPENLDNCSSKYENCTFLLSFKVN